VSGSRLTKGYGLERLRTAVANADLRAPGVSGWSVGMHVHHCCLATVGICRFLAASEPPPPRSRFSMLRSFVLLSGRIPRGRGKAPDRSVPRDDVSRAELMGFIDECERMLAVAKQLDRCTWFEHFAFGIRDRNKAVRFIDIHNRHHLRIIGDIVRKGVNTVANTETRGGGGE